MSATDILKKLNDLYEEIIVTKVRFESLEKLTTVAVAELKLAVTRYEDELRRMDRDHVRERAELGARIEVLSARLDSLGEAALHAVAREAARETFRERADLLVPVEGAAAVYLSTATPERTPEVPGLAPPQA